MAGRKSLKEEIKVVKYMTELAGPTFKFITACYETGDKKDKMWAAEQMMKLYAKSLPTTLETDPNNPITVQIVQYGNNTSPQIPAEDVSVKNVESV